MNSKGSQMRSRYQSSSLWVSVLLLSSLSACMDGSATDPASENTPAAESGAVTPAAAQADVSSSAIVLGTSAQLETVAASRGAAALDITIMSTGTTAPGVVTTVRAALTETAETRSDGIEQSWSFNHAPGTQGDLVIAVGTKGLDYVGTNAAGLQLRRAGELNVSYSNGIWVDASGARTAVPAVYTDGRILLTVPAEVVTRSAYPAVLDPKIVVTPPN